MARDETQCKKCGSTKFDFSAGWFQCQRCGELEPAKDEVIYADDPRLTGEGDGGDAA